MYNMYIKNLFKEEWDQEGFSNKAMNKINEIYRSIMQEAEEMKEHRKKVDNCIENVLEDYKKKMEEAEYEICRDMFYRVAMTAEEGGFVLGFQYAVQLMEECYMKKFTVKPE